MNLTREELQHDISELREHNKRLEQLKEEAIYKYDREIHETVDRIKFLKSYLSQEREE